MPRTFAAIALVMVLSGCHQIGVVDPPVKPPSLRVMTFNIRYGTANDGTNHWTLRREMVFQVFRHHRPDLVGLQEALAFQFEEIRHALPEYGGIFAGRDDGKTGGEACAILYRAERFEISDQGSFWLSTTPEVTGSKSWGNSIPRICTWARLRDRQSGRSFYFFNTHLDHQSQPARELGAELIVRRMRQKAHDASLILAGDLNAGEDNPVVRYLRAQVANVPSRKDDCAPAPSLTDTFRTLHPQETTVGTFNGFSGKRDGQKIDYVLVSPQWKTIEASIVYDNTGGRYPSDHFPVMAVLR